MSNYGDFIHMLLSAKIKFDADVVDNGNTEVKIEASDGAVEGNNLGYIGFFTAFTFDVEGKLLNVGIWER